MPLAMLKSFAEKSKKTEKEVEELWNKAKEIAKQEYPDARDAKYYSITTGILKKSLGLDEESQATITSADISNIKDSKKFTAAEITIQPLTQMAMPMGEPAAPANPAANVATPPVAQ